MTSASRGFASNYRIILVASLVVLAFAGIGWRLADLHILSREDYVAKLDRARHRLERLPARRGDIRGVDRLGRPSEILATSRTLIHLGVDPQIVRPEDNDKRPELATLLGLPLAQVNRIMDTKTRPSPASPPSLISSSATNDTENESDADDINPDTGTRLIRWAKLSDTVEESTYAKILALKIRGIYGNRTYTRAYPQRSIAAHVIGYINKEGTPSGGVEAFADFYLRGQDGWRESEKDGLRRELAQFRIREVPPSDGYDVVISIDTVVQHIVEQEMDNLVATFRPAKATIIVSEPDSGFLLALANYPTYDLNNYSTTPIAVQRNVAVTDLIEPGSTFKIVAASGALNERIVSPDTRFNCAPGTTVLYRGKVRRLMRDDHADDIPLTVSEIISRSSNAGAAQLGILLGDRKFYDYARAFGFGEKSGFPLGYEEGGIFAPPEKWSDIDITRIPAGYSIAATPLQIHYAMAAIANGGTLMTPRILREVPE
uniref:peptidoglycan D,D-transpeptidase FtsI family protein n=1 Tax=Geminisphaera colitermitum TaxID=1148786 RepID=UPI0005BDC975